MRKLLFLTTLFLTAIFFIGSTNLMGQQKRRQKKRPSSTKKISPTTIDQEAIQKATGFWKSKLTQCGDDFYTKGYVDPINGTRSIIFQFKDYGFTMEKRTISNADRLNGLEYRGSSSLNVEVSRTYSAVDLLFQKAGWSRWKDGLPIYRITSLLGEQDFGILLSRENGYWTIDSVTSSQSVYLQPIDCSSVVEK
jgi:hypothetical protein